MANTFVRTVRFARKGHRPWKCFIWLRNVFPRYLLQICPNPSTRPRSRSTGKIVKIEYPSCECMIVRIDKIFVYTEVIQIDRKMDRPSIMKFVCKSSDNWVSLWHSCGFRIVASKWHNVVIVVLGCSLRVLYLVGIGGRGRWGGGGMPAGRLVYVEPGMMIDLVQSELMW